MSIFLICKWIYLPYRNTYLLISLFKYFEAKSYEKALEQVQNINSRYVPLKCYDGNNGDERDFIANQNKQIANKVLRSIINK